MPINKVALAVCSGLIACSTVQVQATPYLFDDGTNQGWSYEIFDVDGLGSSTNIAGPAAAGWQDLNNYPNPLLSDPIGDLKGSANVLTIGSAPIGSFRVTQFISPDLSSDTLWQNLTTLSGQILPSFTVANDNYYANAVLMITDTTGGGATTRYFTNETSASPLTIGVWNQELFTGIDSLLSSSGVSSYTTEKVMFNVWHSGIQDVELVYSLDNVIPTISQDNNIPAPGTILLLGLGLVGLRWKGRVQSNLASR